jgi:hypothetical protein
LVTKNLDPVCEPFSEDLLPPYLVSTSHYGGGVKFLILHFYICVLVQGIIMIGEIGGEAEEKAAQYLKEVNSVRFTLREHFLNIGSFISALILFFVSTFYAFPFVRVAYFVIFPFFSSSG